MVQTLAKALALSRVPTIPTPVNYPYPCDSDWLCEDSPLDLTGESENPEKPEGGDRPERPTRPERPGGGGGSGPR